MHIVGEYASNSSANHSSTSMSTDVWQLSMSLQLPACMCEDVSVVSLPTQYNVYNFFLVVTILPVIALFGLCTNVVNVYIYTRRSMVRLSSNVYLAALGCSDFFVVLTGIFIIWMDSARSYLPSLNPFMVEMLPVLTLGNMAQTCSVYFTVAAAWDCYVRVCRPLMSRRWCNMRRAIITVLLIALLSVGYNMNRFWQVEIRNCIDNATLSQRREICPTQLYFDLNLIYNFYMNIIAMTFLPFFLLSVLNTLIIRRFKLMRSLESKLKDQRSLHAALNCASMYVFNQCSVSDDETMTMVMVVVLFLVCNSLGLVLTVIDNFFATAVDLVTIHFMSDMSSVLVMINSSVNIWIYLIFDYDFRKIFITRFCCWNPDDDRHRQQQRPARHRNSDSGKQYTALKQHPPPPRSSIAAAADTTTVNHCDFFMNDVYDTKYNDPVDLWPRLTEQSHWSYSSPCPKNKAYSYENINMIHENSIVSL